DRGDCAHSSIVLMAPGGFVHAAAGFDGFGSYESVETWLSGEDGDDRVGYKLQLLQAALRKGWLGYNPETEQAVADFWDTYRLEASTWAPELEMDQPGARPAGAGFIWFFPANLPGNLNICHKLAKGYVDLHFPDWGDRIGALKGHLAAILGDKMDLVRAG